MQKVLCLIKYLAQQYALVLILQGMPITELIICIYTVHSLLAVTPFVFPANLCNVIFIGWSRMCDHVLQLSF